MDRRTFLIASALATTGLATTRLAAAAPRHKPFEPNPANGWRTFEVTSRIQPTAPGARVWMPLPSVEDAQWIRPMGNLWQGNYRSIQEMHDPVYKARMLVAEWDESETAPVLEVVSRVATRDRKIDFSKPGNVAPLDPATRELYTRPTRLLPTDGIVLESSMDITQGAGNDLEKARAIYEWIVDKTERNPKTRGCGVGDIRFMLESGDLSGKCADLNALYVGLARAAGLPARDVYGVRVADSRFGYKSLGSSGNISKAQHCRAEVWLDDFGWVPVDPADVRKVVLGEQPGLSLQDDLVIATRKALFGSWEMNWMAYNFAHDLSLPGSARAEIPFLMYPQGENADKRFDSLDPNNFVYSLSSREITA